jgi:hypothetical protein
MPTQNEITKKRLRIKGKECVIEIEKGVAHGMV